MPLSKPPQSPTDATPPNKPADAALKEGAKVSPNLQPADDQSLEQGSSRSKGFDPYNSGAFDRRQTWEKVTRK